MVEIFEGAKPEIVMPVSRAIGTGAIIVTAPQYRVVNDGRTTVLKDWASAVWNSTDNYLSAVFDSTLSALSAPGLYRMQFKAVVGAGTIGPAEVVVVVKNLGP